MGIYVAAGDESDGPKQDGWFLFGGFVAPAEDWTRWFAPAWTERVLQGPPAIPYLHMVDIRSPNWCKQHGLTRLQAEDRIDAAVKVIRTLGSLGRVQTQFDG